MRGGGFFSVSKVKCHHSSLPPTRRREEKKREAPTPQRRVGLFPPRSFSILMPSLCGLKLLLLVVVCFWALLFVEMLSFLRLLLLDVGV